MPFAFWIILASLWMAVPVFLYVRFRLRRAHLVPSESQILAAVAAFSRGDRRWIERVLREHKLKTPQRSAEIVFALFSLLQGCRRAAQVDLEKPIYAVVDSMAMLDVEMTIADLCDVDDVSFEALGPFAPATALHLLHFLAVAQDSQS